MPKSVWVSVAALGYLLFLLILKIIESFRALPSFQTMRVSIDAWVEGQSQWDRFIISLLMLGMGILILQGLVIGRKLAWYASLAIFTTAVLLTVGGYLSGGVPPRLETLLKLFVYLLPSLVLIISLTLPSARGYYNNKIPWKSFGRWFGLSVACMIAFAFSWSFFMVWLSKDVPIGK